MEGVSTIPERAPATLLSIVLALVLATVLLTLIANVGLAAVLVLAVVLPPGREVVVAVAATVILTIASLARREIRVLVRVVIGKVRGGEQCSERHRKGE